MKTIHLLFTCFALAALLAFSCGRGDTGETASSSEAEAVPALALKVSLGIDGMTCSGCEYNVKSAVKKIAGVVDVKADYAAGMAEIEYDPEKASVEQFLEAVNALGYQAKPAEHN